MPRPSIRRSVSSSTKKLDSVETNDVDSQNSKLRRRSARSSKKMENVPTLSAAFVDRHSSNKDLISRLKTVVDALAKEDVDANRPDYPGLAGLAAIFVEERYLAHKDKDVRLYTVMACMECFELYAPEPPWNDAEILRIFQQTIRQLANLAVCTSPSQRNFPNYFRLLEQLAAVKIGVVLVELTRTLDSETSPSIMNLGSQHNGPTSEDALEILVELIRTILLSVHIDHPSDVSSHASAAISACIEEFDGTVPIPILDEILACVNAGSVIYVTNPKFVEATAALSSKGKKLTDKTNSDIKNKSNEKEYAKNNNLPPMQIHQTNQSYMIAASVIRRTEDRISTPIASLLNGILNGEPSIIDQTNISSSDVSSSVPNSSSSGIILHGSLTPSNHSNSNLPASTADVWTIIYELHRISPMILTTVIGTVSNSLQSPSVQKRMRVTKLLGKLFYSPHANIASSFKACFKDWTKRSNDCDGNIRKCVVKCLVAIISKKSSDRVLCMESSDVLAKIVRSDPLLDVRLAGVHEICNLVHGGMMNANKNQNSTSEEENDEVLISDDLLHAVGNRVSSKNKIERKDAVTGLAQIYYRRYLYEKLIGIQKGGDDCDINLIISVMKEACNLGAKSPVSSKAIQKRDEKNKKNMLEGSATTRFIAKKRYTFIPKLIFESACFTDSVDSEMRNRLIQIVDDVLLGSGTASNPQSQDGNEASLTLTSRAVGLAIILSSLEGDDDVGDSKKIGLSPNKMTTNSFKWMCSLFTQKAKLQRALSTYILERKKVEKCIKGSEEAHIADAVAFEKLENVAALSAPLQSSMTSSPAELSNVLRVVHAAKDKHIFKLLGTISTANHTPAERYRTFDELPKRSKCLGLSAYTWLKCLARRCAMGNFINVEIMTHCILLAQESFHEHEFDVCLMFLNCIKTFIRIFPTLAATKEGFSTLVEHFVDCREHQSGQVKKDIEKTGIITVLTSILATIAPSIKVIGDSFDLKSQLHSELTKLCTIDGTPEQAKNAIYTLSSLVHEDGLIHWRNPRKDIIEKEMNCFKPLVKALTTASHMSLTHDGKDNANILRILAALTALAECSPLMFSHSGEGSKAIRFALETIILGMNEFVDSDYDLHRQNNNPQDIFTHEGQPSTSPNRKFLTQRKIIPTQLSLSCQRLCAAIGLLVSHIRSTIQYCHHVNIQPEARESLNSNGSDRSNDGTRTSKNSVGEIMPITEPPSTHHISSVINMLVHVLVNSGLPPSIRDQQECSGEQEKAALRQCATINLFRLCDASLRLEEKYVSTEMWHIIGNSLCDTFEEVRENITFELSSLLTGSGYYRQDAKGFAPSLRFLSLVSLCPDIKLAGTQCITSLRRTCDAISLRCRAISRESEKNFEMNLKRKLMPECAVPFMLHLLSFRNETPMLLLEEEPNGDGEGRHKLLQKRLKRLYQPLVQSLGEGADNISFLLRQTELISKYVPINPHKRKGRSEVSTSKVSDNFGSTSSLFSQNQQDSKARLRVICITAKDILLQLLKTDVNLTPYPGKIQIPSSLYLRLDPNTPEKMQIEKASTNNFLSASKRQDNSDCFREGCIEDQSDSSKGNFSSVKKSFTPMGRAQFAINGLSPIPQSDTPAKSSTQVSNASLDNDFNQSRRRRSHGKRKSLSYESGNSEIGISIDSNQVSTSSKISDTNLTPRVSLNKSENSSGSIPNSSKTNLVTEKKTKKQRRNDSNQTPTSQSFGIPIGKALPNGSIQEDNSSLQKFDKLKPKGLSIEESSAAMTVKAIKKKSLVGNKFTGKSCTKKMSPLTVVKVSIGNEPKSSDTSKKRSHSRPQRKARNKNPLLTSSKDEFTFSSDEENLPKHSTQSKKRLSASKSLKLKKKITRNSNNL